MKRLLSLFCSLTVFLTLFAGLSLPLTASAEVSGDFEYVLETYWDDTLNVDTVCVMLTGYTGSAADLVIPSTMGGYPVRYIGESAFYGNTILTDVVIPDGVKYIGYRAFDGCKSLKSVTIPATVELVGYDAFYDCTSLEAVYITDLAAWCSISFGEDCIASNPLYYAENLYLNGEPVVDPVIPASVTSIGWNTFGNCTSIQSVSISAGVTTIDSYAFSGCSSLSSVKVAEDNTAYCDVDGVLFTKNKKSLEYYPSGKTAKAYTIPYGVTTIKYGAFSGCDQLETIHIPKSVESIGEYAFSPCSSLKSITIPESVTRIEYGAFMDCTSLESVVISESVKSIGGSAFSLCSSLKSITIPESVTRIEHDVFRGCTSLESVVIPESMKTIGDDAFWGCSSLEQISIPQGLKSIGYRAFYDCTSLEAVYITDLAAWCSIAFDDYSSNPLDYADNLYLNGEPVVDAVIPEGITTIGSYAFGYYYSLRSIAIPVSVESIGYEAFANKGYLRDVYYSGTKTQWKSIAIDEYNDSLTSAYIHYNTAVSHWEMTELYAEPSCTYDGWAAYTCDCGYEAELSIPATGHTLKFIETVAPTCTEMGYTLYECTTCRDTYNDDYVPGGHTFENNVCVVCCEAVEDCLASAHKYASDTDQSWYVRQEGVQSISLIFSAETEVEEEYDYLYIYDSEGNLFGEYTGKELAGVQITVPGDFVEIRLVSDESMNYYGFTVTNVSADGNMRGDIDGDGNADVNDALMLFQYVNKMTILDDTALAAVDFNKDGKVNLYDAAHLFYMVNGLI